EYRRLRARTYYTRGVMLMRREEAEAPTAFRTAYQLLEPLAGKSATAQLEWAETCVKYARATQERDPKAAVGYLDTATRLCDGLLQAAPMSGERVVLRVTIRLWGSDGAPPGGTGAAPLREKLPVIGEVLPVCRQYVDAARANAMWRPRLSVMRKLRPMLTAAL